MDEILKYAIENRMIDMEYIQEQLEMKKREEYLKMHTTSIWQGSDGKWYTYFYDKNRGRVLRKRNTKAGIENLIVAYWKEQQENPTIKEVFDEWNDRRRDLQMIALSTYDRNKRIFARHYSKFGAKRIRSVEKEQFQDFLEEQIYEYDLTAKAFSNLKSVTKGFLKRAKKRKLIEFNVEETLYDLDTTETRFKKTIKEDYEEVFSESEMDTMMSYLMSNLDMLNLGLLLLFVTGIRVGELATLKHEDFSDTSIKIRRTETKYSLGNGKMAYEVKEFPKSNAGVRTVVLPEDYTWLCKRIKDLNAFSDFIFVNKNGKRLTTNSFSKRLYYNCKRTGIYNKSPHKIRKTYGTILFDNHVDNRLIMDQMGHADILVGEVHYHRNRKNEEKKSEVLSAIPEFRSNKVG